MTKTHLSLATAMIALGMAGCSPHVSTYGYITTAPPPPRVEVYGVAPGPEFVWINGFWGWAGHGYVWTPGRWERPPRRGATWAPGRWEHRQNHYYWHEGHWR